MNRIYELLKNNECFADKLMLDEATNRLGIVFHEYLRLEYIEGNYTAATDEGLILLNDGSTHWHIQEDEEAIETITSVASGDYVFMERRTLLGSIKLRLMNKEKFAKNRDRYMRRKSLRIYTGTEIIKRNE